MDSIGRAVVVNLHISIDVYNVYLSLYSYILSTSFIYRTKIQYIQ